MRLVSKQASTTSPSFRPEIIESICQLLFDNCLHWILLELCLCIPVLNFGKGIHGLRCFPSCFFPCSLFGCKLHYLVSFGIRFNFTVLVLSVAVLLSFTMICICPDDERTTYGPLVNFDPKVESHGELDCALQRGIESARVEVKCNQDVPNESNLLE
jgi:hypothetical protein